MAPHRMPPELALVRIHPLGKEAAAPVAGVQGGGDRLDVFGLERGPQLGVVANLVLHLPERLDGVPVAVRGRVLEPPEQLLVDRPAGLVHHGAQLQGRRQLREVEHPVDLPVAVVDVDRVLEQDRGLGQAHRVRGLEAGLEHREVALHLGHEAVAPPVGEVLAVDRQDRVEVGAHVGRIARVARHTGAVAGAVLGGVDAQVGIGRDGRRVDVAVDVLGQPVDRERRPEPAEHVVAAEPPATDVEEHRADRMRAVQVVIDPEEALLDLRVPGDRERVVTEELAEDLLCRCHGSSLHARVAGRPLVGGHR